MYAYCLNNPINMEDSCGHCSRRWGFLWKVDCKSSECPTSKNYIKPSPPVTSSGTYNDENGNPIGNVYIIQSSQMDKMNKSKEDNDIIVIDNRTSSNPSMQVRDSYRITDIDQQTQICKILVNYNATNSVSPEWNRTEASMLIEWKAHNDGYHARFVIKFFKENAKIRLQHVDFDNESEGLEYWDYLGK